MIRAPLLGCFIFIFFNILDYFVFFINPNKPVNYHMGNDLVGLNNFF